LYSTNNNYSTGEYVFAVMPTETTVNYSEIFQYLPLSSPALEFSMQRQEVTPFPRMDIIYFMHKFVIMLSGMGRL
jgi:hypothetical protein